MWIPTTEDMKSIYPKMAKVGNTILEGYYSKGQVLQQKSQYHCLIKGARIYPLCCKGWAESIGESTQFELVKYTTQACIISKT